MMLERLTKVQDSIRGTLPYQTTGTQRWMKCILKLKLQCLSLWGTWVLLRSLSTSDLASSTLPQPSIQTQFLRSQIPWSSSGRWTAILSFRDSWRLKRGQSQGRKRQRRLLSESIVSIGTQTWSSIRFAKSPCQMKRLTLSTATSKPPSCNRTTERAVWLKLLRESQLFYSEKKGIRAQRIKSSSQRLKLRGCKLLRESSTTWAEQSLKWDSQRLKGYKNQRRLLRLENQILPTQKCNKQISRREGISVSRATHSMAKIRVRTLQQLLWISQVPLSTRRQEPKTQWTRSHLSARGTKANNW